MNLLVIGGDESVMIEGSPSRRRQAAYAGFIGRMDVVVAARSQLGSRTSGSLTTHAAPGSTVAGRAVRMLRIAGRLCREARPDVISAENPDVFGLIGLLLARRFRLPLQVQVHTDIFSPHYRRASWRERLRFQAAVFVLPRASGIRTVSRRVADGLQRRLAVAPARLTILPIHTEADELRRAARLPQVDDRLRPYDCRLVSAGRFVEREKHFSLLFDVMADLAAAIPRPLLVIVGDGPDRPAYQRQIRDRGLASTVQLEPWRDDLASFFQSFDLFLLPSNFEGWGRSAVEAAAAGLPVVMTDVGLAGELLVDGESARIVPVGDARAMALAVLELHRDPEQRGRLVRAAQTALRTASYPSLVDYHRAYRAALEACRVR